MAAMDRNNSFSSGQRPSSVSSSGAFSYQTRLLERTSSRNGGSLSRVNSETPKSILSSPTTTGAPPRRWPTSHRAGQSLDIVRSKWEDRVKAENTLDDSRLDGIDLAHPSASSETPRSRYHDILASHTPKKVYPIDQSDFTTPSPPKRHTLPPTIIASPLSPNTTGVTVEAPESPSPFSSTAQPSRFHLPVSANLHASSKSSSPQTPRYSSRRDESSLNSSPPTWSRTRRNTVATINPSSTGSSTASEATSTSSSTSQSSHALSFEKPATTILPRRPTSLYGARFNNPPPSSPEKSTLTGRPLSTATPPRASSLSPDKYAVFASPSSQPPVMSPKPYASSYMNKKAAKYGDSFTTGRRFGRHLPRIASGDGPEEEVLEKQIEPEPPVPAKSKVTPTSPPEARNPIKHDWRISSPDRIRPPDLVVPGMTNGDDVAGVPGRIRLSRDKPQSAPSSPLPSSKLRHGLWADVQRNLIQAYEYLCHVGEAQQWIEGCLNEELPFGVVEMEEGLRNGVVLAKLVRVFQGEAVVRRIYEV